MYAMQTMHPTLTFNSIFQDRGLVIDESLVYAYMMKVFHYLKCPGGIVEEGICYRGHEF